MDDTKRKKSFGDIACQFDPTPDGLRAMFSDSRFRERFPNAKLVEPDRVQFEPHGPVFDIVRLGESKPKDYWVK